MKEDLYKLIDAVVAQDDDKAKEHFATYLAAKTTTLLSEATQPNLFGDKDGESTKPSKRFLTKPVGLAFDDLESAKQVAKSHLNKDFTIVDTDTDEVVYSHKKGAKK